jgi:hypothetical protein
MNSVDTFHQRLRDEFAAVEKEIQSHNQQVESLTKRLAGLKRADELFESDQAAIAELLQSTLRGRTRDTPWKKPVRLGIQNAPGDRDRTSHWCHEPVSEHGSWGAAITPLVTRLS